MFCTSPLLINLPGAEASSDPMSGRLLVQCRRCASCIATRKSDLAGRLCAEAFDAAAVYLLTLTYAEEPKDFCYRDVQLMLKQLRKQLASLRKPVHVRFFCVGERGNLKGRIHWHLLLFCDAPVRLLAPKPGKLWPFWEHGWTQVARVPASDVVRRVRYCAKYAVKNLGQEEKACRPRASVRLGEAHMVREAERTAEAALPMHGIYTVPGMIYTKGPKAGLSQRIRMQGASARRAAVRYVEACDAKGVEWVDTPFLVRYFYAQWNTLSMSRVIYREPRPVFEDLTFDREKLVEKVNAQPRNAISGFEAGQSARCEWLEREEERRVAELRGRERDGSADRSAIAAAIAHVRAYFAFERSKVLWDGSPEDDVEPRQREAWTHAARPVICPSDRTADEEAEYRRVVEEQACADRAFWKEARKADNERRAAYRQARFLAINGEVPRPGRRKTRGVAECRNV